MSIRDRVGRFYATRTAVDEHPEMIMMIMARCVVVDCKLHYVSDKFEYVALSPDFDENPPGQMVPDYSVTIEEIDGQFNVSFKRVSA